MKNFIMISALLLTAVQSHATTILQGSCAAAVEEKIKQKLLQTEQIPQDTEVSLELSTMESESRFQILYYIFLPDNSSASSNSDAISRNATVEIVRIEQVDNAYTSSHGLSITVVNKCEVLSVLN